MEKYTYVLLSLAFIIVNLITLSNLRPWIDEVMMLDTSYNAAFHGAWGTTAWYRVTGQYPFSTYPPLYQMLAAGWMWLFGSSLTVMRSMNLMITFALGGACLRLMRQQGLHPATWATALFTVLLWGSSEMAWMYRNGRPDMLCALLSVVTIQNFCNYLSAKFSSTKISVIIASALLLCSGIQAAVYMLALWLFFFIVTKRRREAFRLLLLLLAGCMVGLLLVSLFMSSHGRLVAFVSSIIQYSTTLSGIVMAMLPLAGNAFGIDVTPYTMKLFELSPTSSLSERLSSIIEYRSFLILSATALAAYMAYFKESRQKVLSDNGFLLLLVALYVPFVMNLAGRFATYYRWMAYLPLVMAIMRVATRSRIWCAVFCMEAAVLAVFGVKSMLPNEQWNYDNIRSFVERQHFKSSDVVICPFSVFYDMKPVCDTCYFAGIFPKEFIDHVDYVIEAHDGDSFNQRISDYVVELKADTTLVVNIIDHCEHPSLTLYQVTAKHESFY